MEKDEREEIKCLVITDSHERWEMYEKLENKLKGKKYDYILFLGDSTMARPIKIEENNRELNEKLVSIVLKNTLYISSIFPNTIIYLIPGNRDPIPMFEHKIEFPKDVINLHKRWVRIREGLIFLGLGGSIPTFSPSKLSVNSAFPYKQDSHFGVDLEELWGEMDSQVSGEHVLMLHHTGPRESSITTRIVRQGRETKETGSVSLGMFVAQHSQRVIGLLHGHAHANCGVENIYGEVKVINPGSLKDFGGYAEIQLSRNEGKWVIEDIYIGTVIDN